MVEEGVKYTILVTLNSVSKLPRACVRGGERMGLDLRKSRVA